MKRIGRKAENKTKKDDVGKRLGRKRKYKRQKDDEGEK